MGSFPEASMNPEQASLGTISGNNFGGHAPLVGAHVYVLQPNATTNPATGYGTSRATSILNSTGANNGANNPTPILNSSDPDIPTTWYYQKTDLTGSFNITGDYTCTVGLPVYLYLYGGMPQYPSANNTFSISNVVFSGSASPYTVTLTINTTGSQNIENAYTGEFFTIAGIGGTSGGGGFTDVGSAKVSALNGSDQVVIAGSGSTALSTTQFSFSYGSTLPTGVTTGTNYAQTGSNQVTFLPTFNPGVVNLAVLGNCPSGGFTGSNAISYVYVNEVSTVAAAYAFRPFAFTPSSTTSGNNATWIGTSSTNIAGLQNAAVIANQLYDIQGSNLSTTYAGEGHIARSTTVNGNGLVPQANLDTLGNILAACVDSNNGATTVGTSGSYNGSTGAYSGISTQCNTLFSTATSTGIPTTSTNSNYTAGIQPLDTAQAALNIARHPAGPIYNYSSTGSTNFVSTLFNLPTGNRPFAPDLSSLGVSASSLNDFTIAIDYLPSLNSNYVNYAETVAIDKIGNVWVVANNSGNPYYFYEMSPAGVRSNVNSQTSWQYGTVIIDSNESAWAGAAITNNPVTYVQATSTPSAAAGTAPVTYTYNTGTTNTTKNTYYSYSSIADSLGNVYFGNAGTTGSTSSSPLDYISRFSASSPSSAGIQTASLTGIYNNNNISFLNASIQPYYTPSSGSGTTSAFFEYNAYVNGQVQIDSVQLSSSTASLLTSGGTPTNDTGFPVYGIFTSGGGNPGNQQTQTANCTILNAGKLTTTRSGNAIVPDFHNASGGLNNTNSSLYFINKGTGTSGTCTKIDASTLEAGLNSGWASTLDGNDYIYIVNRSGANSMSVVYPMGGGAESAANTVAISPSTGFFPQYWNGSALTNMLTNPFYVAVGPSGEIWIPNNDTSGGLVEIIGLASPETTPFSVAASPTNNGIGVRP
jgi:hypothetical protein